MRYKGNAESDPGGTFPKDDYFLKCTHVQDKDKEGNDLISSKGNNMWVLEFTVAEGPFANRKMWHYLVWLPEGKPGHGMALRSIHAFGLDPEGENDYNPGHFLNVTVKATVDIDSQPGYSPKNVIKKWFVPDEVSKPDPTEGDAQEPNGKVDESFSPKEEALASSAPPAKRKAPWGKK